MKAMCLAITFILASVGFAHAQALNVDINSRSFVWTASIVDATHPAPTSYNVKCGVATKVYTIIVPVTPVAPALTPPTTVPVKAILTPGMWFCAVTAANQFGESPPSNELTLNAGYAPAAATAFGIQ